VSEISQRKELTSSSLTTVTNESLQNFIDSDRRLTMQSAFDEEKCHLW